MKRSEIRGILNSATLHPGYELRVASYQSVRDEELIGGKQERLSVRDEELIGSKQERLGAACLAIIRDNLTNPFDIGVGRFM